MTTIKRRLELKSYLAMIQNAVGAHMFKSFYVETEEGSEVDVIQDGEYACALFASSVLTLFGKITRIHATVASTVKDMEERGWEPVTEPQPGDVIVWKPTTDSHTQNEHIGFYLGSNRAVSTSSKQKMVAEHDYRYDELQREIKRIYRYPSWDAAV